MFDVCIYGKPVLRRKAAAVDQFDDDLKRFVTKLVETMYEYEGVGLAAPQVGHSTRIAVIDTTYGEEAPRVLINPDITSVSEEPAEREEGCLSLPDINLQVRRPARVSVRALDIDGKEYTIEEADGLLARALLHEIDHLDGILFVDRVSPLQRRLIAGKLKKLSKASRQTPCDA
jgi:peptide deformylase